MHYWASPPWSLALTETQSLRIRPATPGDCADVLRFIRALAEYERLLHKVTATESDLRQTLFGDIPAAEALIAEWKGHPAGFCLFFPNYSTFLARPGIYLEDLYVDPRYRGLGIGKNLLAYLARLTVERGGSRLDWSVLDWNSMAIEFYRTIGARALSEWTQFRLESEPLERLAQSGLTRSSP